MIVLVEDNPLYAQLAGAMLRKLGIPRPVLHFADAESAVKAISEAPADTPVAALVDLHLPGMPGGEFVRWLRKRQPAALIVAMTAYAPFDLPEGVEGADVVLHKPLSIEQLRPLADVGVDHVPSRPAAPDRQG